MIDPLHPLGVISSLSTGHFTVGCCRPPGGSNNRKRCYRMHEWLVRSQSQLVWIQKKEGKKTTFRIVALASSKGTFNRSWIQHENKIIRKIRKFIYGHKRARLFIITTPRQANHIHAFFSVFFLFNFVYLPSENLYTHRFL